ncbi:hypothetical protein Salat_3000300 [Sesamum alatum]|uniref:Uncharacterized protein n=1 Tax=Sesamum alatum TaxID=300844 RepID=A0AAE2C7J7_9LAMI|nr:hypothetical protein Salat_3000300 [Sesamum alatum]
MEGTRNTNEESRRGEERPVGEGEVIANDGIHFISLSWNTKQAFGLSEGVSSEYPKWLLSRCGETTSHSIDGYRVRGAGKGVAYYYMGEKKTVVVKGCRLIPVKGPENKRLLREKGDHLSNLTNVPQQNSRRFNTRIGSHSDPRRGGVESMQTIN